MKSTLILLALLLPPLLSRGDQAVMTVSEFQSLPVAAADRRVPYGEEADQFGELRVPASAGPHPVVVLVHGGCWKAEYSTLRELGPIGDVLKAEGIATWNIEYRRLPQPGSGWPGTYLDVGRAIDALRLLATDHALDLNRVIVLGHSAGGHLAMWAAIRHQVATSSPLYQANPLPIRGVVNLAGTIDMRDNIAHMATMCRGDDVVTKLLGGTPTAVPERYDEVSAITRLPLRVPQVLIWGGREDIVPRRIVEKYERAARQAGEPVQLLIVPNVGHFEPATPYSSAWPTVKAAILSLLR